MNLNTTYLGIPVKSPIIVGSCGLTSTAESIIELANNGAGAIVLKSIFEEEIILDFEKNVLPKVGPMDNDLEFFDYYDYQIKDEVLHKYQSLIADVKKSVDIPVIASINCISNGEWVSYAKKLEEAGADGLELNIFKLPFDIKKSSEEIEHSYIAIIERIIEKISIPLAVKISPYFTNLGEFVKRLSLSGVAGIVLFNRYYSIDFDINNEEVISGGVFSGDKDYEMPLRWISIMNQKSNCELIASTGVHTSDNVIKMLLAGAGSVQVVSALYKEGSSYLKKMNSGIKEWMSSKGYETIDSFKGNMSQTTADKPEIYERVQFMRYFSDHKH
ncbi:MAG: dihydroorotate dehydrogenase-like protein [Marinilabiliaceae bacterium]|nr:dihydroorotate dehydrogenase-like protein [Marinilabiliaceae bacterium]